MKGPIYILCLLSAVFFLGGCGSDSDSSSPPTIGGTPDGGGANGGTGGSNAGTGGTSGGASGSSGGSGGGGAFIGTWGATTIIGTGTTGTTGDSATPTEKYNADMSPQDFIAALSSSSWCGVAGRTANYATVFYPGQGHGGNGFIFDRTNPNAAGAQGFNWHLYKGAENSNYSVQILFTYDDGHREAFGIRFIEATDTEPASVFLDVNGGVKYVACDAQP